MPFKSSQMVEVKSQNLNKEFNASYERFSDAIFRYCLYQTSNRQKALDLTQDTFIKTWEYLSTGKQVENLRAFLYKVAGNLIIDDRRKKKSESLDKITEQGFDVKNDRDEISIIENAFEKQLALDTLEKLDKKYRNAIILRFVEDMEIEEIAKTLKESKNNISVRIHRGLEKLKIILEENQQ